MEEKKLSIDINKKDLSQYVHKMEEEEGRNNQMLPQADTSLGLTGDHQFDNWYELRFTKVGPDRRGYHSSFIHNKK